jgi:hypothetical protein
MLAATFSASALAASRGHGNGGGGGESQKGGLPALEDRVEADEALITALQGQNNWAVVSSTATVVRSFSSAGPVTAAHPATGHYEVTFSKDVSACAYEATIGKTAAAAPTQGQISVSGDSDPRAGDRLSGLYLVGSWSRR